MKTGLCNFSGLKIYPGHGIKYVRIDNKAFTFAGKKETNYFLMKRNPRKIRWTQVYRRMHKKGSTEEAAKKKARNQKGKNTAKYGTEN